MGFFLMDDIPDLLCSSVQPNQLIHLELTVIRRRSPNQQFIMQSKPFSTHLTLWKFSLTLINIDWDSVTHVDLSCLSTEECLELLHQAPALEYYLVEPQDDPTVNFDTTILYPQLCLLNFSHGGKEFLEVINVPLKNGWCMLVVTTYSWQPWFPFSNALAVISKYWSWKMSDLLWISTFYFRQYPRLSTLSSMSGRTQMIIA